MQSRPLSKLTRVVITGANGFVGSEVLRAFYDAGIDGKRLIAVVRKKHGLSPQQRMQQVFQRWVRAGVFSPNQDIAAFSEAVEYLEWDDFARFLAQGENVSVIHAAADTAFDLPLAESRRINVGLTRDVIDIAQQQAACVERFLFVSTAFVAGKRCGRIMESDQGCPSAFNNAYEQSKWESEQLVRRSSLNWCIVRPGIIVGDSRTGFTLHFRVVYSVVRMWLRDVVPRAPLSRLAKVDLVPSDFVAKALLHLCELPLETVSRKTLHLCAGDHAPGPVEVMRAAANAFDRPPLPLSPPWVLRLLLWKPVFRMCGHAMQEILTTVSWHMPYLGSRNRVFDTTEARAVLGDRLGTAPEFKDYGRRLFLYCATTSWGRKCLVSS
jgi:nucleoside-diphosphate-sugar epimerase